jgi:hypothetical protein
MWESDLSKAARSTVTFMGTSVNNPKGGWQGGADAGFAQERRENAQVFYPGDLPAAEGALADTEAAVSLADYSCN